MKKTYERIISIFMLLMLTFNVFCQNSKTAKSDSEVSNNKALGPLFLIDGFPLYKMDELNKIDPQTITTINVSKDTLFDCSGSAIFYGLIVVTTKDSVNTGLKYILQKTGNWIMTHPLAEYWLNAESVNQNTELRHKLYLIDKNQIVKIKVKKPIKKRTRCNNGILTIKTK